MPGSLRITDIRPTRKGRFSLFSGDEFLFSVDGETLAKSGVEIVTQLTGAQLEQLQAHSDTRKAKDKALQYLSLRTYGSSELYAKLCRSFDEPTAAAAMAEMDRLGLLDDEEFARRRAVYWQGQQKSLREIRAKLLALGLGRELVDRTMADLTPEDEATALRRLVEKQYRTRLARGEAEKVLAALARRGFSPRLARTVVREFLAGTEGTDQTMDREEENEWL